MQIGNSELFDPITGEKATFSCRIADSPTQPETSSTGQKRLETKRPESAIESSQNTSVGEVEK